MVEVAGFEPVTFWSRTRRATKLRYTSGNGANKGTRTLDLRFTKPLLYRLSYIGRALILRSAWVFYHDWKELSTGKFRKFRNAGRPEDGIGLSGPDGGSRAGAV